METKVCCCCKRAKFLWMFSKDKNKTDGLDPRCKACCKANQDRYYARHKEAYDNSYRRTHLKLKYGITPEQYESLWRSQNGLCAVCGDPETMMRNGRVRRLNVDHNHTTEQVRQLLCYACNSMIGYSKESIKRLLAGAEYLVKHSGAQEGVACG